MVLGALFSSVIFFFNLSKTEGVTSSNNSRWIKYELAEASIANLLELNFTSTNTQTNWFKLEGSNYDETWDLLLERQYPTNSLFNNGYRIVFYHMANETAYKYYKLTCLATNDSSDNWDLIGFKLFFINRGNGKPHFYSLVPTLSSNSQDGYEVTASSNYGSHYPYHAFDNSSGVDNKWLSADSDVNGAWLKIELPEATAANTFQIQSPNEGYRNRAPKKFKIQGSNDDTIWTDLISEINLSWTQNQMRKWNIENETAFKFFRILIEESNGANFVDIGEFTIGRTIREYKRYLEKSDYLVPVMSSNSQDGYVASASSVFNSDHAIWKAFDRNINSTWATQDYINPPQWLRIKLPTAKKCEILQLTSRNDKWWTQIPKDFILQGSNDGSTWTDLLTQTNVNWTEQAQTKRFNIPTSNQADYLYYRIYMTANKQSTFYAFAISEFQLINKELIQEY